MTLPNKQELIDSVARLQLIPFRYCKTKDEAYELYLIIANMAWEALSTANIMAVSRDAFDREQERLFESAWSLVHRQEQEWPELID